MNTSREQTNKYIDRSLESIQFESDSTNTVMHPQKYEYVRRAINRNIFIFE